MDQKQVFSIIFLVLLVGIILVYMFLTGIANLIAFFMSIFR